MISLLTFAVCVGYLTVGFFGTGITNRLIGKGEIGFTSWTMFTCIWPLLILVLVCRAANKMGLHKPIVWFVDWSQHRTKKSKEKITA